jgi:cytochrome c oxidase subunit 2
LRDFLNNWMPPDYSAHGHTIDDLIVFTHWLMLILFIFWGGYFLYVLYRFRASRNPKASYEGMKSHWSTWSEVGVAVVEVVLLLGFSIPAWSRWAKRPTNETNPLELRVVAEQFAWNVHYAGKDGKFGRGDSKFVSTTNPVGLDPDDPAGKDDVVSLNNLHLEVNRDAVIHISSKDVIHSFKLPVMRAEQDAVPGMDVPIHLKPIRTNNGEQWEIACAQLCGLGHYRMRGQLFVDSKADFEKWLASQAPENPATTTPNPVPAAAPVQPGEPTTASHH